VLRGDIWIQGGGITKTEENYIMKSFNIFNRRLNIIKVMKLRTVRWAGHVAQFWELINL
jgi:hypothetical protein